MSTLELIDTEYSGNAWKIRLLAGLVGVPLTRRTVSIVDGDLEQPWFREVNPFLQVPVLRTREGTWLAESMAILWYLGADSAYVPDSAAAQAQTLQWLSFEQTMHMHNFAQPRLWVHLRKTMSLDDPKVGEWQKNGYIALGVMEEWLSKQTYFGGATATIADVALYPYTAMAAEGGYQLADYPQVQSWLRRIERLPGYQSLLQKESQ